MNVLDKRKKSTKETAISKKHSYLTVVPKLSSYGFVVIPLNGKAAMLPGWNKLTHTPSKLAVFQNRNFGVVTGQLSGITVLDVDVNHNGLKVWKAISNVYPAFVTPMVRTPSGGLHIYFSFNKNLHSFSKFTLRDQSVGWDLLNNGRQCVVPPSIHPVHKTKYKWIISPEETPFIRMPYWLEYYLVNMKQKTM